MEEKNEFFVAGKMEWKPGGLSGLHVYPTCGLALL
jgi:hypothetical protein